MATGNAVGLTFSDLGLMSDDAMRSDTQPAVLAEPKDRSDEKVRPDCRRLEPLPTPKVPPADGGSSGALASLPRGVHCSGRAFSCLGTKPTAFQSCSEDRAAVRTQVCIGTAPPVHRVAAARDMLAGALTAAQGGLQRDSRACRCCSWSPGQHTQQQSNAAGCLSG